MYDILQLHDMLVPELLDIAEQLQISGAKRLDKLEIIYKILDKQAVEMSVPKAVKQDKPKRKRIVKAQTVAHKSEKESITPLPAEINPEEPELKKDKPEEPAEYNEFNPLTILIDPGTAPNEEVAGLLTELSRIYRKMGGSGIVFKLDHVTLNQGEGAYEL